MLLRVALILLTVAGTIGLVVIYVVMWVVVPEEPMLGFAGQSVPPAPPIPGA
jgi:phage shock protein PspC (stress-responsive transcriptional regulator)